MKYKLIVFLAVIVALASLTGCFSDREHWWHHHENNRHDEQHDDHQDEQHTEKEGERR